MNIVTIIPAAGKSTRMGKDKSFLEIKGKTIISRQVELLIKSSLDPIYIITNHPDKMKDEFDTLTTEIINAEKKTFSMLESIRLAIKKIPANVYGAMILPGDFPIEKTELLNHLKESFIKNPEKIIVPVFQKKRGHPIIVAAKYFKNIINSYDDIGLKGLLQQFSNSVLEMEWHDNSVLNNLNSEEDYLKYTLTKNS